ncbi:hypothetical protein OIU84_018961 [Salix udensis]|uniref:Uncharacterized protein n=1 Tax=Salix udensis TaxID=889485 RepID=A0AAD6KZ41_9ROSI|nr:hypothetical protein OIU84_018961 [Salix udensis]
MLIKKKITKNKSPFLSLFISTFFFFSLLYSSIDWF